jgi:hypothetical protein
VILGGRNIQISDLRVFKDIFRLNECSKTASSCENKNNITRGQIKDVPMPVHGH